MLVTRGAQLQDFTENPNEFVSCTFDLIGERKSKTLQVEALNLLDSLLEYIDSTQSHFVQTLLEVQRFVLQSSLPDDIASKFPLLSSISGSVYFSLTSPAEKLESSLLLLSALHDPISSRKDLLSYIKTYTFAFGERFTQENISGLISQRFIIFVFTYMEELYGNEHENSQQQTSSL
jgi:hypothetical protein